jgi:hypothetical protein
MAAFQHDSGDVRSRDELIAEVNQPQAIAQREQMTQVFDLMDNEQIAPSKGLSVATHEFRSSPDGNTIKVQLIRPEAREPLPCVYYIHGGGMQAMSCFDGMYSAGSHHRAQGRGGDGRLPQRADSVVGARWRPVASATASRA